MNVFFDQGLEDVVGLDEQVESGTRLTEVAWCLEMGETWSGAREGYSWSSFCLHGLIRIKEQ